MRYFLDTEFYEDGKTIDLISIGVVAEDGREFYAVSQEAQLHRVSDWVRNNVLPSLPPYGDRTWMTRGEIAGRLMNFVVCGRTPQSERPEFWAYYADYDWVVLCQLFGTMMDLPVRLPRFCRDLKQMSADLGGHSLANPVGEHNALVDARWNRDLHGVLAATKAALR